MHDTYIMLNKPFNYPSYLFVKVWGFRPYKPTIAHLDVSHFMISISIYICHDVQRRHIWTCHVSTYRGSFVARPRSTGSNMPIKHLLDAKESWKQNPSKNSWHEFHICDMTPKTLRINFLRTLSFQNSFALATLKLILHRKCWCGDRWQLSNKLTSVYSREGQWLSDNPRDNDCRQSEGQVEITIQHLTPFPAVPLLAWMIQNTDHYKNNAKHCTDL